MDIASSGSKGTIWRTFWFIVHLPILMNLFNHSHYSSHDKSCVITCYAGLGWTHRTCHPENLVCPSASLLGIAWFLRSPRAYNFNYTLTNKQLILFYCQNFDIPIICLVESRKIRYLESKWYRLLFVHIYTTWQD